MMEGLKARAYGVLRWSEKYTKTDMVYLTKGGFWLVFGQVLQGLSGLVLIIAFANLLPKEVYGTYQFVMSMAIVISAITLTGMDTAIIRTVARGSEGALRTGFRAQLTWSSGMIFIGAALAAYYYVNGNTLLALSFLIVGAFSPFLKGFELSRAYLIGKHLFHESALLGLGRRFIPLASLLVTLFLTQDPLTIIFVYFASNTLAAGLLYRFIVRRYGLPFAEENEMVSYSKHISFLRTSSDIANQADKILVWVMLGAAPLAAYALAQLPISQVQGGFKLLRSLSLPKLSTANFSELKLTLPRKVRMFLALTAAAAVGYILLVPFVFGIFFPAYPESVLLSQVLALSLLAAPRTLYWQALTAHGKMRELYIINLSQSALRILLLFILLPLYGVWGAVWALLATLLYANIVTRIFFKYAT